MPRASASGSRAAPTPSLCDGVNRSAPGCRVATRTSAVRFCSSPPSALLQIVTSLPRGGERGRRPSRRGRCGRRAGAARSGALRGSRTRATREPPDAHATAISPRGPTATSAPPKSPSRANVAIVCARPERGAVAPADADPELLGEAARQPRDRGRPVPRSTPRPLRAVNRRAITARADDRPRDRHVGGPEPPMLRRRRHEQRRAVAQRGEGDGPARHRAGAQERAAGLAGREGRGAARRVARQRRRRGRGRRARRRRARPGRRPSSRSTSSAAAGAPLATAPDEREGEQRRWRARAGHPTSRRSKSAQPAAASAMPAARRIAIAPGSSPSSIAEP